MHAWVWSAGLHKFSGHGRGIISISYTNRCGVIGLDGSRMIQIYKISYRFSQLSRWMINRRMVMKERLQISVGRFNENLAFV